MRALPDHESDLCHLPSGPRFLGLEFQSSQGGGLRVVEALGGHRQWGRETGTKEVLKKLS